MKIYIGYSLNDLIEYWVYDGVLHCCDSSDRKAEVLNGLMKVSTRLPWRIQAPVSAWWNGVLMYSVEYSDQAFNDLMEISHQPREVPCLDRVIQRGPLTGGTDDTIEGH